MILYREISEIPQHNWEQLNLTGDLKWLIKEESDKELTKEEVEQAYFMLCDQSAEVSGSKTVIEDYIRLVVMKMEHRLRLADGDNSAQNNIDIVENKIQDLIGDTQDADIVKQRLLIQRLWKQPINAKETTHLEFLKIKQIVEEEISLNKEDHGED